MAFAIDQHSSAEPMRLAEAQATIRSQLLPVLGQEAVPLSQARGRVLAVDLVAGADLPLSNNSAVDGFALRAADLALDRTVSLKLVGVAAAGHPFKTALEPGQAIEILTGAPLPAGADTIVMQEACFVEGNRVGIPISARGKRHWRRQGEDVAAGSRALPAGRRLRTEDIALAGALGCKELPVFKRLRVSLFSTGDELCEPGEMLEAGQIWDANRCLLRGLLEQMGCEVHDLGILRDEPHMVEGALSAAARDADLLVTSGGMSVGREDHIRSVIGRRGTLDIWPLAIKPGKPVGLGDIDACPILALPGNPIAAVVTFVAIGRSVVDRLSGAEEEPLASFMLPASFMHGKPNGVRQYLLASVTTGRNGASMAVPQAKQGSAMLSAMAAGSGLIVLHEDCERIRLDDLVEFVPLSALLG